MAVVKIVDFSHFGCKIGLPLFTNLTKNPWDNKTRAQELTSSAIRMFLSFLDEIWEYLNDGRVGEKNLTFLPFLKVHDQLQTNGISKRFDAQQRDCTKVVDFLT